LLRLRGGAGAAAGRVSARTPSKIRDRAPSTQPLRLPVDGVQEGNISERESNAVEPRRGKKQGKGKGQAASPGMETLPEVNPDGGARHTAGPLESAAPQAAAKSGEDSVGKYKRHASEVVTGEYFRKVMRAAEVEADRVAAVKSASKTLRPDVFRPGAADATSDEDTALDGQAQKRSRENPPADGPKQQPAAPQSNKTAFIPVIYDGVSHRPPVHERDEWLELFRSMDTYTNVIDLKLVQGILDRTGVRCVDHSTLKFAGFLVDAYISRICNYASDWVRLRLEGEEELREAAAKAANKLSTYKRQDPTERVRNLNFTLLETDVLHALNEMKPGADLDLIGTRFMPRGKAEDESSSAYSDRSSDTDEQSQSVSSNAARPDGQLMPRQGLAKRGGLGLEGEQEGERGGESEEESAEYDRYLDETAALEMARFGLSRKQTAELERGVEERQREEKLKGEEARKRIQGMSPGGAATVGIGVGGGNAGIDMLLKDSDADDSEADNDDDLQHGLGIRIQGLGFRVQGLGFRV
jgi:hypothetical protein